MMNRYREILHLDGTVTLEKIDEAADKITHGVTYGDIISAFRRQYPHIHVLDYRPAEYIPLAIIVWVPGGVILAQYQSFFDIVFILGQKQDQEGGT